MAYTNTSMSFLMYSENGTTYTKLVDISEYPDLGGAPETIDVTTLSDTMSKFINGIQSADGLEFPSFFTPEKFQELKKLEDGTEHHFAIWFGGTQSGQTITPTGDLMKCKFDGQISTYITGKGVNEARAMSSTISVSSEFEYEFPSASNSDSLSE